MNSGKELVLLQRQLGQAREAMTSDMHMDNLGSALGQAGFTGVRIKPKGESREFIKEWAPGLQLEDAVVSH